MEKMFKKYRRKAIAELREVTDEEVRNGSIPLIDKDISISEADLKKGSPLKGDMIARNPKNSNDQWLVAKEYFCDNFEEL